MVELAHHVLRTGALVRVHGADTEILLEHRRASSPAGGITMLQEICETVTSSKGLERGCVCLSWRAAASRQNGKSILSKAPASSIDTTPLTCHPAWRNIYLRSAGSVCCFGPRVALRLARCSTTFSSLPALSHCRSRGLPHSTVAVRCSSAGLCMLLCPIRQYWVSPGTCQCMAAPKYTWDRMGPSGCSTFWPSVGT